ncbi:MAG: ATP-binding protein [Bernardetiaceae bacterium]|nr:ATP-binding protein [Bernardetiaceae bacterium]
MQIKDIRTFRTDWKKAQGYDMPEWDEHFIGSIHENKSGFYKMVNGIVSNIKADLTPKLQNAQDEQAIYEFLQNAADSLSTDCAVIYDEHYFMVINNGKPFSKADVQAILNSFQGTKADKTKAHNCDKIGRYGIGFKLAHRLVGKSDGADELIRDLAGPVIFSWQKAEQLQQLLAADAAPKLESIADAEGKNKDLPWLFKIVLSCFPASPDEKVRDLQYAERAVFENEEYTALHQFLQKHKAQLENLDLKQGSLFFLKFGEKKHEKLKQSLLNVSAGIGYSLNTLKTLQSVVLQDRQIERFPIEAEKFRIQPEEEAFKRIDPEFPFCPIDITFGYPKDTQAALELKEAPSLYQFFPMRNERHRFAFFIHASSFAKITDRTRLDDQGEANIETFSYIVEQLEARLNDYKENNFERFAHIFKAILLSDASAEYNKQLLNTHLYEPLLELIQNNLPTAKKGFYPKEIIVLKNTKLPLEPMNFGVAKEWFYWNDPEADAEILKEANLKEKLNLPKWGLKQLIKAGDTNLINAWIEKLSDTHYAQFIEELRKVRSDEEFLQKFSAIKCFRFKDGKGKSHFYAIDDLAKNENNLLINEKTQPITEVLRALEFAVLDFNIAEYKSIYEDLQKRFPYLEDEKLLFNKIAERSLHHDLTPEHKNALFVEAQKWKKLPKESLLQWKLFQNQKGEAMPVSALIAPQVSVEAWLEPYKIAEKEYDESLSEFLIQKERGEIYTQIIYPNWESVAPAALAETPVAEFYESIKAYFELRKFHKSLEDKAYIFVEENRDLAKAEAIFYHKNLQEAADYKALQSAIMKMTDLPTPDEAVLPFLNEAPFKTPSVQYRSNWNAMYMEMVIRSEQMTLEPAEKSELFELLLKTVDKARLTRLALFTNRLGLQAHLNELIAPQTQVPAWLEPFKIKEEEATLLLESNLPLESLCVDEAHLYQDIIQANWEVIIEQEDAKKNVKDFYEKVLHYFRQHRKNKPLESVSFIYSDTAEGFLYEEQSFFHKQLQEAKNYKHLAKAIEILTGLQLPTEEALPYLGVKPFACTERLLEPRMITPAALNKSQMQEFLAFYERCSEPFFTHFCIEEDAEGKHYNLIVDSEAKQYYLGKGKQKLVEAVAEKLPDTYKLLPHRFYNAQAENEGLLLEEDIFKILLEDSSAEEISKLISESGSAKAQVHFFEKLQEVRIKESVAYATESMEAQALQSLTQKNADSDALRQKILLEDKDGNIFKLEDYAYSPTQTLDLGKQGKIELQTAALLPHWEGYFALCEQLIAQFAPEQEEALRQKVFYNERSLSAEFLLEELRAQYSLLENASQLTFVLAQIYLTQDKSLLNDFEVRTLGGNQPLASSSHWYVEGADFIREEAILASDYADMGDILNLEKQPIWDFAESKLLVRPCFSKVGFECQPLKVPMNADLHQSFLQTLYENWLPTEDAHIDFAISQNDSPARALGFEPKRCLLLSDYARHEEQLPDSLTAWLEAGDSERKTAFLQALGVHTAESPLLQMRRYLKENEGIPSQKQVNAIVAFEADLDRATLYWLMEQELEIPEITEADERLFWVRKLYNNIEHFEQALPLPYVSQVEEGEMRYTLAPKGDYQLYYSDEARQKQLQEKYGFSLEWLLEKLEQDKKRMTCIDLRHLELPTSRIQETLALEVLEAESREWDAPHYLAWKGQVGKEIWLIQGQMPYQITYLDTNLGLFRKGNVAEYEGATYVNGKVKHISDALHDELSSSPISQNELLALIRLEHESETAESSLDVIASEQIDTEVYDVEKLQSASSIIKGLRRDAPDRSFIVKASREGKVSLGLAEWQLLRQDSEARVLLIGAEKQEELTGDALLSQKGRFRLELDLETLDAQSLSQIESLLSVAFDAKMIIHKD